VEQFLAGFYLSPGRTLDYQGEGLTQNIDFGDMNFYSSFCVCGLCSVFKQNLLMQFHFAG